MRIEDMLQLLDFQGKSLTFSSLEGFLQREIIWSQAQVCQYKAFNLIVC